MYMYLGMYSIRYMYNSIKNVNVFLKIKSSHRLLTVFHRSIHFISTFLFLPLSLTSDSKILFYTLWSFVFLPSEVKVTCSSLTERHTLRTCVHVVFFIFFVFLFICFFYGAA